MDDVYGVGSSPFVRPPGHEVAAIGAKDNSPNPVNATDGPRRLQVLSALAGGFKVMANPFNGFVLVLVYLCFTLITSFTMGLTFVPLFGSVFAVALNFSGDEKARAVDPRRIRAVLWNFNPGQVLLGFYVIVLMIISETLSVETMLIMFPLLMFLNTYVVHLSLFHGQSPLDSIKGSVLLVRTYGVLSHFLLWVVGEIILVVCLSVCFLPFGLFVSAGLLMVVVPGLCMVINECYTQVFESIDAPVEATFTA